MRKKNPVEVICVCVEKKESHSGRPLPRKKNPVEVICACVEKEESHSGRPLPRKKNPVEVICVCVEKEESRRSDLCLCRERRIPQRPPLTQKEESHRSDLCLCRERRIPQRPPFTQRIIPAMAAVIPLDIVYNILVQLSAKTLNKFRTVCRQWNALISLPLFQHENNQHENNRHRQGKPLLLALRKIGEDLHLSTYSGLTVIDNFTKPVPELYLYPPFHSIQSCNGLVCIASKFGPVVICNPFTEELLTLPPTQGCIESNGCIGFGYVASVHEFKVVKFYRSPIYEMNCCRVFSLGTGGWREATRPRFYSPICCGLAPFLHGYLHILHYGDNTYSATAFDIAREEYTVIPIPKFSHYRSIELKELGGSLCLVNNHDPVHLSLWLLKDYNSREWVKEYDIILSQTLRSIEIIGIVHVNPLVILDDGTILLHVWKPGFDFANQLLCYNPEDKTITDTIDDYCSAVFYMESFQSLRSR